MDCFFTSFHYVHRKDDLLKKWIHTGLDVDKHYRNSSILYYSICENYRLTKMLESEGGLSVSNVLEKTVSLDSLSLELQENLNKMWLQIRNTIWNIAESSTLSLVDFSDIAENIVLDDFVDYPKRDSDYYTEHPEDYPEQLVVRIKNKLADYFEDTPQSRTMNIYLRYLIKRIIKFWRKLMEEESRYFNGENEFIQLSKMIPKLSEKSLLVVWLLYERWHALTVYDEKLEDIDLKILSKVFDFLATLKLESSIVYWWDVSFHWSQVLWLYKYFISSSEKNIQKFAKASVQNWKYSKRYSTRCLNCGFDTSMLSLLFSLKDYSTFNDTVDLYVSSSEKELDFTISIYRKILQKKDLNITFFEFFYINRYIHNHINMFNNLEYDDSNCIEIETEFGWRRRIVSSSILLMWDIQNPSDENEIFEKELFYSEKYLREVFPEVESLLDYYNISLDLKSFLIGFRKKSEDWRPYQSLFEEINRMRDSLMIFLKNDKLKVFVKNLYIYF